MMLSTDLVMGLIGLAFVPIGGWALGRMGFPAAGHLLRVQELMAVLTLTMEENLQGIRVVRAFAGKRFEMAKFDAASHGRADLLLQAHPPALPGGGGDDPVVLRLDGRWCSGTAATRWSAGR